MYPPGTVYFTQTQDPPPPLSLSCSRSVLLVRFGTAQQHTGGNAYTCTDICVRAEQASLCCVRNVCTCKQTDPCKLLDILTELYIYLLIYM